MPSVAVFFFCVFITNESTCSAPRRSHRVPTAMPLLLIRLCAGFLNSFFFFICSMHKSPVIAVCLYSTSALLIHLCISPPKETESLSLSLSLTRQPHYSHTLPPTDPPLVGLIIACHFATHTHTRACMHTHTHYGTHANAHTCPPSAFLPSSSSFIPLHEEGVSPYYLSDICGFSNPSGEILGGMSSFLRSGVFTTIFS